MATERSPWTYHSLLVGWSKVGSGLLWTAPRGFCSDAGAVFRQERRRYLSSYFREQQIFRQYFNLDSAPSGIGLLVLVQPAKPGGHFLAGPCAVSHHHRLPRLRAGSRNRRLHI